MSYIYDISRNPENIGYLEKEDLYTQLYEFGANYVKNVEEDDAKKLIDNLLKSFEKVGCEVGNATIDGKSYRYFIFTDEAKKSYFTDYLQRLKALVEQATIEDFALDTTLAYDISMLANDRYGDRVCDGYLKTIDTFIRDASSGEKYYISNKAVHFINIFKRI